MKVTLLLLLFNGTMIQATLPTIFKTLVECSNHADTWRESNSSHSFDDPRGQGWYLDNGKGTMQGYYCE